MSSQPMSPNEERLWDEVNGLKAQLGLAMEGWMEAVERTEKALEQTDRSIAQTQQVIAILKERDAAHGTEGEK